MADTDELLRQGIRALKAGQTAEARRLLMQVVQQDKRNEMGWLWLSGAVDTDEDRRACLENVLAINPGNQPARRGIEELNTKRKVRPLPSTTRAQPIIRPTPQVSSPVQRKQSNQSHRTSEKVSSGANALAAISVICGLIGLIVFGIPLGIVALACGIPASAMGAKTGTAGVVLGILDIIFTLAVLILSEGRLW